MASLADRLHDVAPDEWHHVISAVAARTGADMELFATSDIAGSATLAKLKRGEIAYMEAADGHSWAVPRAPRSAAPRQALIIAGHAVSAEGGAAMPTPMSRLISAASRARAPPNRGRRRRSAARCWTAASTCPADATTAAFCELRPRRISALACFF